MVSLDTEGTQKVFNHLPQSTFEATEPRGF